MKAEFAFLMEILVQKPVDLEIADGTVTLTAELVAAKVEEMLRSSERAARLLRLEHQAHTDFGSFEPGSSI